ncbi:hypothetical protein AVDCRST_MAG84-7227 [uncultured Microcoleus sp.]|uniref:Uncharacterized protein n=1 Tax=uncultured Microcoleus sp. TaxID=259945 RepID=A0A6J4PP11_9CYAN|nr:hypothetical protein AVDCRST_MAG84-7227 [uncultured Microcoleus sp.]
MMVRGGVAAEAGSAVKTFLRYLVSVDRLIRSRVARSETRFFNFVPRLKPTIFFKKRSFCASLVNLRRPPPTKKFLAT